MPILTQNACERIPVTKQNLNIFKQGRDIGTRSLHVKILHPGPIRDASENFNERLIAAKHNPQKLDLWDLVFAPTFMETRQNLKLLAYAARTGVAQITWNDHSIFVEARHQPSIADFINGVTSGMLVLVFDVSCLLGYIKILPGSNPVPAYFGEHMDTDAIRFHFAGCFNMVMVGVWLPKGYNLLQCKGSFDAARIEVKNQLKILAPPETHQTPPQKKARAPKRRRVEQEDDTRCCVCTDARKNCAFNCGPVQYCMRTGCGQMPHLQCAHHHPHGAVFLGRPPLAIGKLCRTP